MDILVQKFWCFALCLNCMEIFATSSPSDMLIIRHGRSRVRHSDHIRWGLKAFDLGKLIHFKCYNMQRQPVNHNIRFARRQMRIVVP